MITTILPTSACTRSPKKPAPGDASVGPLIPISRKLRHDYGKSKEE
jgi:hypothetical protein